MISQRVRESKRVRAQKLPKNIERAFKESKCRDCAVVVTRMDFAKILGKFTKVKIQYESSSTPKTKKNSEVTSPTNSRLKSNENGMVLLHRNAYSQHPVKELLSTKKPKANNVQQSATPRQANNVLKENNRLKKGPLAKDKNSNINISSSNLSKKKNINSPLKQYRIIFIDPVSGKRNKIDSKSKISLTDLLPLLDKSILPTEEWCFDYLPRKGEPMDDKVYDRIAAELEDLMYNEKPHIKIDSKTEPQEHKVDEFPSIMDILNDNSSESSKPNDQSTSLDFKANLESSDVEAMLLGKSTSKELETIPPTPMEVDNTDISNFIEDVAQLDAVQVTVTNPDSPKLSEPITDVIENPHSPSILDEALQKGIEEHLPNEQPPLVDASDKDASLLNGTIDLNLAPIKLEEQSQASAVQSNTEKICFPPDITHLIFKKNIDGNCIKTVTCPKNLKYSIELEGKHVEFLGAPNFISSLEDLQVLLQIVNETDLQNLYVYH